jgi:predicted phosphodiesterase
MKFVVISDTHNNHKHMDIPEGDVLIHAGDFTSHGSADDIVRFNTFLGTFPHKYKILIAGNHDLLFEKDPKLAQSLLTNCLYLQDSAVVIEGIKIYGSPWQPWFYDWAFNLQRGAPLKAKWDMIPDDVDILITHGPPHGHGDKTTGGEYAGCEELLQALHRVQPKYHLFGHIHEGYSQTKEGPTICINASTCNFSYSPINPPIVFEL